MISRWRLHNVYKVLTEKQLVCFNVYISASNQVYPITSLHFCSQITNIVFPIYVTVFLFWFPKYDLNVHDNLNCIKIVIYMDTK